MSSPISMPRKILRFFKTVSIFLFYVFFMLFLVTPGSFFFLKF